jgi:hypothetical protein
MTTTEHSYETAPALTDLFKRYSSVAAFVGLIFLALTIAGAFIPSFGGSGVSSLDQFMRSYLVGFWLWFGAGAGCLVILMTQYLTGGAWGLVIRRLLEAGAKTLYVFVLLFLPLLIFRDHLYWWTTHQDDKVIQAKNLYLNVPFLWIRWAVYSAFFLIFLRLLTTWSKEEDATKSTAVSAKMEALSGPGVWGFFIVMTFCAIDYMMILEPYWYSTVYGFMVVIGGCLTALSIIVATLTITTRFEPMQHAITKKHLHDLGKLLFALTMLWAYLNFSQLLITWSGNLPTEVMWYIKRWNGGWGWVGVLMLLGHFVLPFLLLLSQDLKKNPNTIRTIAIYLVIIHAIDVYYLVEPNFTDVKAPHFTLSWLDITAPIGFGGLWLALFFRNLPAMPLLPLGAPDLKKALNHGRDH